MSWRSALASLSLSKRAWSRHQGVLRALRILGGYSPLPLHLDLFLTWRCNLSCPMCNLQQEHNREVLAAFHGAELSLEEWRGLVDDVKRSFPLRPNLNFLGGEPTLVRGYLDLMAYAVEQGFRCTFITNGTRLTREAERIVASGVAVVTVSLDGPQEVHDRIRGPGVFDRAVEGIRRLQEAKAVAGSRQPEIFIATTVMRENHDRLAQVLPLARELGVAAVTFLHLQFPDCDLTQHGVQVETLLGQMDEVARLAQELGVAASFYPHLTRQQVYTYYQEPSTQLGKHCVSPLVRMSVLPDGTLVACGGEFVLGNLRAGDRLRDVWNGDTMRAFRRLLLNQGVPESCCRCCRRFF